MILHGEQANERTKNLKKKLDPSKSSIKTKFAIATISSNCNCSTMQLITVEPLLRNGFNFEDT